MNNIINIFKSRNPEKSQESSEPQDSTSSKTFTPPVFVPTEKQREHMEGQRTVKSEESEKGLRIQNEELKSYGNRNIEPLRNNTTVSNKTHSQQTQDYQRSQNAERAQNTQQNSQQPQNNQPSQYSHNNRQQQNSRPSRNSQNSQRPPRNRTNESRRPFTKSPVTKSQHYSRPTNASTATVPTKPHSQYATRAAASSNNPNLQLCTLSGTNEIGRNCSFIEYNNSILIIDCGFGFPEQELYGVDYMIPNTTYLEKNKHKIKAVLITHGHLDHTGALPYVLPKLDFPQVYAGRFASALIKERLAEFELVDKTKIVDVFRNTTLQIGPFKVSFIGVTHSIPNAYSIFIESAGGNVFFSGDYKIDLAPANEEQTDYLRLKTIEGKADMALMESTRATDEGKAKSATEIAGNLEEIVSGHTGRVIIASFSSLVSRIFSLMQIAVKTNRKVVVIGRSLNTALKIAQEQKYINIPANLIIKDTQLKDYSDRQIMIVCTGSQGESNSALSRISLGEHKTIKAKQGDLIMISASEIPDNISAIQHMTDRLIQAGADIIKSNMMDIHESGHGLIEDMRLMFDMVKPRYVMPIHGWLTLRYQNKKNYLKWGMTDDNTVLTEDGQIWELQGRSSGDLGKWVKAKQIDAKPFMIDGMGIGNVGETVIKDRQQLAEYGVLTVLINLSSETHKILGNIKLDSRGFIYMQSAPEFVKEMTNLIKDIHMEWYQMYRNKVATKKTKLYDNDTLKGMIEKGLGKFLNKRIERKPVILVWTI